MLTLSEKKKIVKAFVLNRNEGFKKDARTIGKVVAMLDDFFKSSNNQAFSSPYASEKENYTEMCRSEWVINYIKDLAFKENKKKDLINGKGIH